MASLSGNIGEITGGSGCGTGASDEADALACSTASPFTAVIAFSAAAPAPAALEDEAFGGALAGTFGKSDCAKM